MSTDFTLLYKKLFSFLHFSFHRYYLASLLAVCMHAHTHTPFFSPRYLHGKYVVLVSIAVQALLKVNKILINSKDWNTGQINSYVERFLSTITGVNAT